MTNMVRRPLPCDSEAEDALASALCRDDAALDELGSLTPEDIYQADARAAFEAAKGLAEIGRCNRTNLRSSLLAQGLLGEHALVTETRLRAITETVYSAENAAYYAETVAAVADRRKLVQVAEQIIGHHEAGQLDDDRAAAMRTRVAEIGERTIREEAQPIGALLDRLDADRAAGVVPRSYRTGLLALHEHLRALSPGDLGCVAGRPGHGKSTLMRRLAFDLSAYGPVLYWGLEEPPNRIASALQAGLAGVPKDDLRHNRPLSASQLEAVMEAGERLRERDLRFLPPKQRTIQQLAGYLRKVRRRSGLVAVIIDYLQLIDVGGKPHERHAGIAAWTRTLKQLALELDIVIVIGSQLNREGQSASATDRRPRLAHLRESGAIEADIDWCLGMFNLFAETREMWCSGVVEVDVLKNRDGHLGRAILGMDGAIVMELEPPRIRAYEAKECAAGGLIRP